MIKCDRIDITNMKHFNTKFCDCKLEHESCIPDYLDHFVQENTILFNSADIILIERQPPVGITNVQDLLFIKFRSKVILISPRSVHSYFNMSKDYDIRKVESELISKKYLDTFDKFNNNTRRHDMSDAMLMIIFYYKIYNEKLYKNTIKNEHCSFEQFRFTFLTQSMQ